MKAVIVAGLALLGTAFAAAHFFVEPYNENFALHPWVVKIHVVLGGFYLLVGVFQFVPAIRRRWIGYHRFAGRLLVPAALMVGATAIFIGVAMPFSGYPEQIIMTIFGTYFIVSIAAALASVRAGAIDAHRRWMIRAYAIGSAVVTMRLIFIPALVISPSSTHQMTADLSIVAFTLAFVLHGCVAESWIAKSNRSNGAS